MSGTDLIRQVIEYLSKKGYTKTEQMLRAESASANQDAADGRPFSTKSEQAGGVKYQGAFSETAGAYMSTG